MNPTERELVHARRPSRAAAIGVLTALVWAAGCASTGGVVDGATAACEPAAADAVETVYVEVYRRAETDRADRLAEEVARLKDDLRRAEEALVAAESDLSGVHSRADAVSSIAEARIQVDRAAKRAPWRAGQAAMAAGKLEEAERQLAEGHFGAALFFTYRARRVAADVLSEAAQVDRSASTRFVNAKMVNLRSGPSTDQPIVAVLPQGTPVFTESRRGAWLLVRVTAGPTGWVHSGLLRSAIHADGPGLPAAPEGGIAP